MISGIDGRAIVALHTLGIFHNWEVAMAPLLKLMDITGPKEFPAHIVLLEVIQTGPQAGQRQRLGQLTMSLNTELERNLFEFDDQSFANFTNPDQIRMVIADADHPRDLGETIINATDSSQPNELFIKFFVNGIVGGPFYELGYRVLPG